MAFQITLSTAATKSAYQRFGDAFITAMVQAMPELDMTQCQSILSEVVGTVGRKAPKEKKEPKAKKSPKSASPTKRDLKKVELIGELKSYGAFAGDIPDISSTTIGSIRKQITSAKKAKKDTEKAAKKAKKSPKKAKKSKKEATVDAGPSKRDLKKAELLENLAALGGSLEDGKTLADYSVTDLRKLIKEVTPKKKKGRKAKSKASEADHEALLATLASSIKAAEAVTVTTTEPTQPESKEVAITVEKSDEVDDLDDSSDEESDLELDSESESDEE